MEKKVTACCLRDRRIMKYLDFIKPKRISLPNIVKNCLILLIIIFVGCSGFNKVTRKTYQPTSLQIFSESQLQEMKEKSPFMKAHMQNGNVYVLESWDIDSTGKNMIGYGTLFDTYRDSLRADNFSISIDSVAIFETNVIESSGTVAALTVYTGITAAITIICITNPKACFGSCPTFYVADEDSLRPQAEGFSASIAPSLEAKDIDALFNVNSSDEEIKIEMRNEALETHVVRHADLLVVPKLKGHRIFCDLDNRFWESNNLFDPVSAISPEGDCLSLISKADGIERFSSSDSTDLKTKEIIELEFDNIPQHSYGLVIGCRQTLLSTYLLYQTYAYMGDQVGYLFAKVENGEFKKSQNHFDSYLGGIEVMTQTKSGDWEVVDQVNEYGPLAIDQHLIQLGDISGESVKIRLRMTKGNWRIDYVALASLTRPIQAMRLHPDQVYKDDVVDNKVKAVLCDSTQSLTTLPGDTYTLQYKLSGPANDFELFLESRGYYLEWIRKEWIEEENPFLLSLMLFDPEGALKRLAPEFKRVEADMEDCFWRSRYAKPNK